jgi:hypothetical protein
MPRKRRLAAANVEAAPIVVEFADLFDDIGTADIRYGAAAAALNGRAVTIEGFLAHSHESGGAPSLLDQPGLCPDCAPVPAAAIALLGVRAPLVEGSGAVRVTGRLDYGFHIIDGTASMLRILDAEIEPMERKA